jgi:hypothetical protein
LIGTFTIPKVIVPFHIERGAIPASLPVPADHNRWTCDRSHGAGAAAGFSIAAKPDGNRRQPAGARRP